DDDFAAAGAESGRDIWDFGPVAVVRTSHTLVLGPVTRRPLLTRLAAEVETAVPRVTRVWGAWQQRVVVIVPGSQDQLAAITGEDGDLSQIAAVSVAELGDAAGGYRPVGNRILVNPANFDRLRGLGRRVVLTHEVTHVASRSATGPRTPTWVVEGFADYVGYLGTSITVRQAASELAHDVRAGRVPARLPADTLFDGDNADLAEAYEQAWLACRMVVAQTSERDLVRFYRAVGSSSADTTALAVRRALATVLHTSPESFTRAWRAYLRNQLG
ncbi:MAG: basic secretory family protein, partial [Frankia sp.]|nr:basic secretory family protein [Frankia sp.]